MKASHFLFFFAASVFASSASAINVTRSIGPTVMNGQIVEVHEGTCTSTKFPGQPWRVWMDSNGWHAEGPKGSYAVYSSAWNAEAMKVCGEMDAKQ